MKTSWSELPAHIRAAVENRVGTVATATDVTRGASSDLSTVLHTATEQRVFLKGVKGISLRMRWLRNEITAGTLAAGIAPAVLFHDEVEDWLLVGFEHLTGRPASLAPGSPDLPIVASLTTQISALTAPSLRSLRDRWTLTDAWTKLAERAPASVSGWDVEEMTRRATRVSELVHGTSLVHTDLHGAQFLLDDGAVHVIDWGFPAAGAPWVDGAFLVLRLIEAGHEAADAERWALSLPTFAGVDHDAALDAFSAFIAGLWSWWEAGDSPPPGTAHRARLARSYAASRLNTQVIV